MSENLKNSLEKEGGVLVEWIRGLNEAEKREISILVSTYGYSEKGAPELLLLNTKGVAALRGLILLAKRPGDVVDGYNELNGIDRANAITTARSDFRSQLEDSLRAAADKLYDYEDPQIVTLQQQAEALFAMPELDLAA